MIKEVTTVELTAVAELGPKFWKEAGLPGEFKPEVFVRNWTKFIDGGIGRIFAYYNDGQPVGCLGLLFVNDINDDSPIASETFWFVDPAFRGCGVRLLMHAQKVVQEAGCKRFTMVHLMAINENLSKLYHKMGFVPVETHYIKTLN